MNSEENRAKMIARVTWLLPELADASLAGVEAFCEAAPKRSLDRATLDEQQRAREGRTCATPCEWCDPDGGGCECGPGEPLEVARQAAPHTSEVGTPSEKAEVESARRGEALRKLWHTANTLRFASDIELLERRANELAKDPEIVGARASSPETGPFAEQHGPRVALVGTHGIAFVPGEASDEHAARRAVEHSGERGPRSNLAAERERLRALPCSVRCWRVGVPVPTEPGKECVECGRVEPAPRVRVITDGTGRPGEVVRSWDDMSDAIERGGIGLPGAGGRS